MSGTNDKELQNFLLFFSGVGIAMYSTKKKGLYLPGLMTLIVSTSLSALSTIESFSSVKEKAVLPKYIAILIYTITLYMIYRMYEKHEKYIHDNNIKGDFKKYSKYITYITTAILISHVVFTLNDSTNYENIIMYSMFIYILTLQLILIYTDMYIKLKHR